MKVTLKKNHKLVPIELFYLHTLAYHKQDRDDIDCNLLHTGNIFGVYCFYMSYRFLKMNFN